jgi:ATP-dependent Clp protease adapter protein ClpS
VHGERKQKSMEIYSGNLQMSSTKLENMLGVNQIREQVFRVEVLQSEYQECKQKALLLMNTIHRNRNAFC